MPGGVHTDLRGVRRHLVRHLLPPSLHAPGPCLWLVLVCLCHVLVPLLACASLSLVLSLSLGMCLSVSVVCLSEVDKHTLVDKHTQGPSPRALCLTAAHSSAMKRRACLKSQMLLVCSVCSQEGNVPSDLSQKTSETCLSQKTSETCLNPNP